MTYANGLSTALLIPPPSAVATERPLAALAEPFLAWFAFVRRRSENTVRAYAADLADFLTFAADARLTNPRDVRVQHVEFYLSLLLEHGKTAKTANRRLYALRAWWAWMKREGIVASNVPEECYTLPEERRNPDHLTIPTQERVIEALGARTDLIGRRDYALVVAAFFAGLRCSELANLRLEDVDLDGKVLRVVQGKGRKDREIPLVPFLCSVLAAYLTETRPRLVERPVGMLEPSRHGFVVVRTVKGKTVRSLLNTTTLAEAEQERERLFPRPEVPWVFVNASKNGVHRLRRAGEAMNPRSIWHIVNRAVSPIVGKHVHPHVLRHSFASRLHARGGDLGLIQGVMGHASPATTMKYVHLASDRTRRDMTRLLARGSKEEKGRDKRDG